MNIKHNPLFDIAMVTEQYSQKDGVPVKYVCTTDLVASDVPCDVYYRKTPHPTHGNCYFGLYYDNVRDSVMICNADRVEELEFGCVENDAGELEYSESHHAFKKFENGQMIDGGRVYTRSSLGVVYYGVKNGEFFAKTVESFTRMGDLKFTTAGDYMGDQYVYPGSDCQE